jgi:hypothetical protein
VATVVYGDFEWDEGKAEANLAKHGVSFEEAADALATDPNEISIEDPTEPGRVDSLVLSPHNPRVLFVVSTDAGARTRVISARKADRHEQHLYSQDPR